jgi:hypothetical protein
MLEKQMNGSRATQFGNWPRHVRRSSLAAMALASLMVGGAEAATIKVVLLGGQSNMDGRAASSGLSAELQSPQEDVLFYYRGNSALTTLRPGSGTDFGPEVTFGRAVADGLPAESFALIKHAAGGTNLYSDWDPATGGTYSAFRNTVGDGLAAITAAGHNYEIVGMLWTQGESDAKQGRTTSQYEADLIEFVADVRGRYGDDLPFFLSRLSADQTNISTTQLANVRAAQENFAAADSFGHLIDTDGMGMKGDNLHFDAAGQIALGEAFGQSYIDVVPEPSGLMLCALGGLLAARRRRV